MSSLFESVRAAIEDASWVERRDSFGMTHNPSAEARAAMMAVAEWLKRNGKPFEAAAILEQLEEA